MVTLFTTGKPFRGRSGVIQRNALKSWTLLHPDVEVILFGDDEGAAKVARELGVRHEPHVERDEKGLKRLDCFFDRAQEMARHEVLCYANCDIVLTEDFWRAMERVTRECLPRQTGMAGQAGGKFLMVGRRWDTEVRETLDFGDAGWRESIWRRAQAANHQRPAQWIDYFAFTRGLYAGKIPGFVIGRVHWDNWLIWEALRSGAEVIDASATVRAIHQNHDYSYHPQGVAGVFHGEEAGRNYQLAGGWKHLRTIADATLRLTPEGLRPNRLRYASAAKRYARQAGRVLRYQVWQPMWFAALGATRPLRSAMGLRTAEIRRRGSDE
jgi:hypothetical protein